MGIGAGRGAGMEELVLFQRELSCKRLVDITQVQRLMRRRRGERLWKMVVLPRPVKTSKRIKK